MKERMQQYTIEFIKNIDKEINKNVNEKISKKVDEIREKVDIIIVDFHAEATSEKIAMGYLLDGKVNLVFGTHTHFQTADECILSNHTGYITDAGMCGAELSVLGVKSEIAIKKQRFHCPVKFVESDNPPFINGIVISFDEKIGKADNIKRLMIR